MRPAFAPPRPPHARQALVAAATVAALVSTPLTAQTVQGQWRLDTQARAAASQGPLAAAERLVPGTVALPGDDTGTEATLGARAAGVEAQVRLASRWRPDGRRDDEARLLQLAASGSLDEWQWSAGKLRLGWDVGQGFRPNDVVALKPRRSLLPTDTEGRGLLQIERFWGADQALSVVWVRPDHVRGEDPLGAEESALALRGYQRLGAWDLHAFGRWGRHSRGSLGAALSWVASDALELHASVRTLQARDGWADSQAAGAALVTTNPWHLATRGPAGQALLGVGWTGEQRQGLLLEAWHDGTAPDDATWRRWSDRNQALQAWARQPGLPAAALGAAAGNLVWQASPLASTNLRQDNVFVRASWQPEPWSLTLDLLWHPADGGRLWTAGAQWQGDRWRLDLVWRVAAGPDAALLRQLPSRRTAVAAASWRF
jgi:hypothetical protein